MDTKNVKSIEVILYSDEHILEQYQQTNHYLQLKWMVEQHQGKLTTCINKDPEFKCFGAIGIYCRSGSSNKPIEFSKDLKYCTRYYDDMINPYTINEFNMSRFKIWLISMQTLANAGNATMKISRDGNGRKNAVLVVSIDGDYSPAVKDLINSAYKRLNTLVSPFVDILILTNLDLKSKYPIFYNYVNNGHSPYTQAYIIKADLWYNQDFNRSSFDDNQDGFISIKLVCCFYCTSR